MKPEQKKIPQYGKLRNFIIDQDLDQRLARAARKENCSVSALIRKCCHEALEAREHISDGSNN